MPYLEHRDTRLYYETHGNGPPLVLLHGVGGNHASWFHQVSAWCARFRLVVIDARGFGKSTDAELAGRSGFTGDLATILDHLGLNQVSIVAQSMGAGTAIDFACRHPGRVISLVLADSLVGMILPKHLSVKMKAVQESVVGLSQAERVLGERYRAAHPAMTTLYLQLAGFNRYDVRTLMGEQTSHTPQQIAAAAGRVLFVVGEDDVLFPADLVSEACSYVPSAQLLVIPGVGHSAYFEGPAQFNKRVGAWLEHKDICDEQS